MAAGPLNRIVLAAGSVADDLSYVALADIARVLSTRTTEYRMISGLMVTALAARWDLGASLYRETLDADLGVPPLVLRDLDLADWLKAAGYEQVAGDRFERLVPDVPAGVFGVSPSTYRAAIDVLAPARPLSHAFRMQPCGCLRDSRASCRPLLLAASPHVHARPAADQR